MATTLPDRAQELLAQLDGVLAGPMEAAGFTLALEDELRPIVLKALREVRAEALEEAARLVTPNAYARSRMRDTTADELEALGRTLRAGAGVVRSGKEWPR